jgi:hypothetical protein
MTTDAALAVLDHLCGVLDTLECPYSGGNVDVGCYEAMRAVDRAVADEMDTRLAALRTEVGQ